MNQAHGNLKREKSRRLAQRCEVQAYVAPQRMKKIASERTEGMLHYFILSGSNPKHLQALVESAYMQGIHDILDVLSGKYGKVEDLATTGNREPRTENEVHA